MTSIVAVPMGTYPAQTRQFGPATPPNGTTKLMVAIDRTNLGAMTTTMDWAAELSQDSGTTWLPWGAASTVGGDIPARGGGILTESYFVVNMPPSTSTTRLRGSVTTRETLTLALRLEVT